MGFDGQSAGGGAMSGAATGATVGGPYGAVIGGVAGGLLGGFMGKKKSGVSEQAMKEALAYYASVGVPPIEAQQLVLEDLQSQGQLTPELETAIRQGDSELGKVDTNPAYNEAQQQALANLESRYRQGLTQEDMASLNAISRENDRDARASQDTILQNMATRGMSGSGAELAAQLSAGQASADRESMQDQQRAAMVLAARQQAAEQAGNMATNLRNQEFGEGAQKASAQDAINAFNTQSQQGMQSRNVASQNAASATNLGEKQRIADANVGTRNAQQQYNKGLLQSNFDNQMKLASSKAATRIGGVSNQIAENSANNTANASAFQSLVGGANSVANAIKTRQDAADKKAEEQRKAGL